MSDLRQKIQSLARAFDAEDNAASDLWTWLPSYEIAKKNHGDYAFNFQPTIESLMVEASMVLANYKNGKPFGTGTEYWPENECPCGEYDCQKKDES
jgi:hypothetical protein